MVWKGRVGFERRQNIPAKKAVQAREAQSFSWKEAEVLNCEQCTVRTRDLSEGARRERTPNTPWGPTVRAQEGPRDSHLVLRHVILRPQLFQMKARFLLDPPLLLLSTQQPVTTLSELWGLSLDSARAHSSLPKVIVGWGKAHQVCLPFPIQTSALDSLPAPTEPFCPSFISIRDLQTSPLTLPTRLFICIYLNRVPKTLGKSWAFFSKQRTQK